MCYRAVGWGITDSVVGATYDLIARVYAVALLFLLGYVEGSSQGTAPEVPLGLGPVCAA